MLAEPLWRVNVTKSIKINKEVIRLHSEHCHRHWPPHPLSSWSTRVLTAHWRAENRRPLCICDRTGHPSPHTRAHARTHWSKDERMLRIFRFLLLVNCFYSRHDKKKPKILYTFREILLSTSACGSTQVGSAATATMITIEAFNLQILTSIHPTKSPKCPWKSAFVVLILWFMLELNMLD